MGVEPTTFSLGGRRAIHCATRTVSLIYEVELRCMIGLWNANKQKQKKDKKDKKEKQTKIRQRRDLNSRGQSPLAFKTNSLTTRTRCLPRSLEVQHRKKKLRHRRDLNSRGQSPVDFESTSLTTRTRCLVREHRTRLQTAKENGKKFQTKKQFDSESKFRSWDL